MRGAISRIDAARIPGVMIVVRSGVTAHGQSWHPDVVPNSTAATAAGEAKRRIVVNSLVDIRNRREWGIGGRRKEHDRQAASRRTVSKEPKRRQGRFKCLGGRGSRRA